MAWPGYLIKILHAFFQGSSFYFHFQPKIRIINFRSGRRGLSRFVSVLLLLLPQSHVLTRFTSNWTLLLLASLFIIKLLRTLHWRRKYVIIAPYITKINTEKIKIILCEYEKSGIRLCMMTTKTIMTYFFFFLKYGIICINRNQQNCSL